MLSCQTQRWKITCLYIDIALCYLLHMFLCHAWERFTGHCSTFCQHSDSSAMFMSVFKGNAETRPRLLKTRALNAVAWSRALDASGPSTLQPFAYQPPHLGMLSALLLLIVAAFFPMLSKCCEHILLGSASTHASFWQASVPLSSSMRLLPIHREIYFLFRKHKELGRMQQRRVWEI